MVILLLFAFLAGLVTILTPCIWPLLPIILSGSIGRKGHQRPLGITMGIMVSFAFFTLAISTLIKLFHFDPNVLRLIAVLVISVLGVTMIIPPLSLFIEGLISRLSTIFGKPQQQGNGFSAGFITGISLGLVWSPCAGPILAAIATLAATGQVTFSVILVTIAYVVGAGIPLFLFAYGGQQLILKTRFISQHTGRIQQAFGILMLLTALAIYTNYDQYLQSQLLNTFPQLNTALNGFENSSTVTQQLNILKGKPQIHSGQSNTGLFNADIPAPDFTGITKWLNTDKPLSISDLKGKVVLVDFWTYTCINCIRTLPYVTSWYNKYKDDGFVVIGVHTPEFAFEHDTSNVLNAIKMFHINYPVAQDNNYATWNAYNNQYWPAEYLIDATGTIRREEFGEGQYNETELAIQTLLKEEGKKVTNAIDTISGQTPENNISPETYLGSGRMQYYYPDGSIGNGTQTLTLNETIPTNSFSYGGVWTITNENAIAGQQATLVYHFVANKVYIILNPGVNKTGTVQVFLDGKVISQMDAGKDVHNGIITVTSDRLYSIIDLGDKTQNHTLKLLFQTPGVQAFTFTFG